MQIEKGIEIIDLALLIEKKILVISDTQIGYEESLNKQGILIPRQQYNLQIKRLEKILDKAKPETIIINGDIKHEFGTISKTEWRHTLKMIDFLASRAKVILIRGNHDTILGPIAEKKEIEIRDYYNIGNIYLCHGHEIPENKEYDKARIVIIGHAHPAIGLRDHGRLERYKCFLKGRYKDKLLIVQPSFNLLTEGSDVLSQRLLSPFLKQDLKEFEVFVVSDEVMYFSKIGNLA
ncbi:metallophosphoesterase [Candidatus Woesearchaeota archaeon]|nr:metallophosphoesterase [Candidatus Woesearchaeota archaeon]